MKKCVLSRRWNVNNDSADVASAGRLFQIYGPTTGKVRLPTVHNFTGGTIRWLVSTELRERMQPSWKVLVVVATNYLTEPENKLVQKWRDLSLVATCQKMSPNCCSRTLMTCWHCCSTSSQSSVTTITSHVLSPVRHITRSHVTNVQQSHDLHLKSKFWCRYETLSSQLYSPWNVVIL